MTKAEQFFDKPGIALAALGLGKVEKLSHCEIPRMRRHKEEKPGFHVGVAEGAELGELVFAEVHGLKT
jgi:hypothetical protein